MLNIKQWQSGTALVVALGMTASAIAPLTIAAPAEAKPYRVGQLFPSQRAQRESLRLPAGTRIPVSYEKEKIVVTPTETAPVTLEVAQNIRSRQGTLLIPKGSEIKGEVRPSGGGSRFLAQELVLTNGERYNINATSRVVTTRQDVRRGTNTNSVIKGAAIGAAAAAVLAEVTGDIDAREVLGGAGLGALGGLLLGGRKQTEVVVIDPETDLALTLNSTLALR